MYFHISGKVKMKFKKKDKNSKKHGKSLKSLKLIVTINLLRVRTLIDLEETLDGILHFVLIFRNR